MKKRYWVAAGSVAAATLAVSLVAELPKTSLLDAALPTASAHVPDWQTFAQMPLAFERNQGQTDAQVAFLARGPGYGLFLTRTEAVLSLQPGGANRDPKRPAKALPPTVVRMSLLGASSRPTIDGEGLQPGVSNYVQGESAEKWQRGVARYDKVRYRDVYPGVDVVYYGKQRELEYDFIVAPGRDPRQIAIDFDGIKSLRLDQAGNLILQTAHGDLTQHKPVVYQEIAGQRRPVEGRYELLADNRVGFAVGKYDATRPLVIDPVFGYTTYFGGTGDDSIAALELDDAGNLYVTGTTASTDFPLKGAGQANSGGNNDVFVSKFIADGNVLIYSTYLGGGGQDVGVGIAVDASGNAHVTGHTTSTNFPVQAAVQPTHAADGGLQDAFVAKLSANGSSLVYSTYLGGAGVDYGLALDLDSSGNAYVAGSTASANFLVGGGDGLQDSTLGGTTDGFVTRLNAAGGWSNFSFYFGGSATDEINGIAVDATGAIFLTGATTSSDFPVNQNDTLQRTLSGSSNDAFVTEIDPPVPASSLGYRLGFSSYWGGGDADYGYDIAVDANKNVVVGGKTSSSGQSAFPLLNAAQGASGGGVDGFLSKFNLSNAGNLVYSTYIGGSGEDVVSEVELDDIGAAYVVGYTKSTNLPGPHAAYGLQATNAGGYDAFAERWSSTGSLFWATYLGGSGDDYGYALGLYGTGSIFLGGSTSSTNLTTRSPFQTAKAGGTDALIARFGVRSIRTYTHDFNADRNGDLFWRSPSDGVNTIWYSAKSSTAVTVTRVDDPAWKIVGTGDFTDDLRADILWRNSVNGTNLVWPSGKAASVKWLTTVGDQNWKVAGTGDFDGDGIDDIFWRNSSNGANVIWLSGDSTKLKTVTAITNLAWQVVGIGDFDGDFKMDVLWRNTSTGANVIWSAADYSKQIPVTGVTNQAWRVAGVGDFLGDGKSDILWRNVETGVNVIWRSASSSKQQPVAAVNLDWTIAAVADYNGDGRSDIFWRNTATGANIIWRSAAKSNRQTVTSVANQAWKPVP